METKKRVCYVVRQNLYGGGAGVERQPEPLDVLSGNQDFRPKWLPQVVERAVQLAPSNAAAKQFVLAAQPQLLQAVPELQAQIASVK